MPHELDTNKSFMSAREPAWHRLGIVKESWFTAHEALSEANLGYEVLKVPAFAEVTVGDGNGQQKVRIATDDYYATVRKHPETGQWEVLGIVGEDYQTFQNIDAFAFMDEVVGNIGGAHYETAGALRGGRQIFLSVSTESADIVLDAKGRDDRIKTYILCFTSHDGSLALSVVITPTRVVCANTLAVAISGSERKSTGRYVTRHTGDIHSRVQEAKRTLGIYHQHTDLMAEFGERMIQTTMVDNTFTRILEDLFVVGKDEVKDTDRDAMFKVRGLYELSPTNQNLEGTLWGGLQAVVEYDDWVKVGHRGSSDTRPEELRFRQQLRLDGVGDNLKQRAWDRFVHEMDESSKLAKTPA